ncbi:MAG TPA: hypothetical protein VMF89_32195, partial [Polyangiales bacterium]|nr:hypothetical protein [Polyangiales bacterium]
LGLLGKLVAGSVRLAREELDAELLGMGSMEDARLRGNLLALEADLIALRCARRALANVRVRFRARFGFYVAALTAAERKFMAAAAPLGRAGYKQHPRHIPLPAIDVDDELTVIPGVVASSTTIDNWVEELRRQLRAALRDALQRALTALKQRGRRSVAHTRIQTMLALYKPPPS